MILTHCILSINCYWAQCEIEQLLWCERMREQLHL